MNVRAFIAAILFTALSLGLPSAALHAQDNEDLCATKGNLIPDAVCRFNGFRGLPGFGRIGNGFNGFILSGRPDFTDNPCDSPECPAQRIWSDGETWEAGIYTQVNVTPGQGYRARVGWFTPRCPQDGTVGRVGIDPTGGTDPRSPNVIWNNYIRLQKSNQFGTHQVSARAIASTLTVFVDAKIGANCTLTEPNGTKIYGNIVWIDGVILVPDGSVPTLAPTAPPATNTPPPPPTATRVPPTRTPTSPPATNTPPSPPTASFTPTATATTASTATPTPTETQTPSPAPTATRRPTLPPTPEPQSLVLAAGDTFSADVLTMGLLGATGCSLLMALALGSFAVWFWKRR